MPRLLKRRSLVNYKRIAHNMLNKYNRARSAGFDSITLRTRAVDVNALALAVHAKAPKVVVYYECLTDKVMLKGKY